MIGEVGRLKHFPEDFVNLDMTECRDVEIPRGEALIGGDIKGAFIVIEGEKIRCSSSDEARYIQYSALNGKTVVRIPKSERMIRKAVKEYRPILTESLKRIDEYLTSVVPDDRIRKKMKNEVWMRVTGQK